MAWGLHAHSHQVVTVFHLVKVFMSVKWLRNCASDTVIQVLQRGAKAEDGGGGKESVPRRPHGVLLGNRYAQCHFKELWWTDSKFPSSSLSPRTSRVV